MVRRIIALVFIFAMTIPLAARAALIRDGDYEMRGTYEGVLFCPDCPGVWTEVTLEDNGPDLGIGRGTFVMTQRYSGGVHRGNTVVTTGTWIAISRDAYGTSGLVKLQGTYGDVTPRYFLCEGGRRLRAADAAGMLLGEHQEQSSLTRVVPAPTPVFLPLTQADANHIVYGRVGDRFSIDLLPTPAPGTTPNPKPDFSVFALVKVTEVPFIPPPLKVYGKDAFVDIVAANPGTTALTFRSRSKPARPVTFEFEIQP